MTALYEKINKHNHYYREKTVHISSVIKSINIYQQMMLSGTWDTTSSVSSVSITNYMVAFCKWSVLVITALYARKDIAHCSDEKHKQDIFTPQTLLRTLVNIYNNMKGQRPLILEIKPRKDTMQSLQLNCSLLDTGLQKQQHTSV